MFKAKKQEQPVKKPISIDKADIKAFLGAGSHFEGKLNFNEMVRLDGNFKGQISSTDTLIVGETAEIEGEISVGIVILSGKFSGEIKATTLVELRNPAVVNGTIETRSLKIEDQVVFNGEVKMPEKSKPETNQGSTEKKK